MSEVKGFRISEVIRYVTGNFPSPTTAMYHLLHHKLTNYYASVRASLHMFMDIRQKTMVTNNRLLQEKEKKFPAILPSDDPDKQKVDRKRDSQKENDSKDTTSSVSIMDLEKEPNLEEKYPEKAVIPDNKKETIVDIHASDDKVYKKATTPYKVSQKECQDHRSSISIHLPVVAQKYIIGNLHKRKLLTHPTIRSQDQSKSHETSKETCLNKEGVRIFLEKPTWPQVINADKAAPKKET